MPTQTIEIHARPRTFRTRSDKLLWRFRARLSKTERHLQRLRTQYGLDPLNWIEATEPQTHALLESLLKEAWAKLAIQSGKGIQRALATRNRILSDACGRFESTMRRLG